MKIKTKQSGFTIIEMLVTIVVTSLLTVMLMQILMLTIKANIDLETRSRYQYESYLMSESIRDSIFDLQAQEIENVTVDPDVEIVIEIRHLYGFTTNSEDEIVEDPNPVTDVLRFNVQEGNLYYNNTLVNDPTITLGPNTTMDLISIDQTSCDLDTRECSEGILELTLELIVILPGGDTLAPQIFVTRILI